jgi:hypothetical protein
MPGVAHLAEKCVDDAKAAITPISALNGKTLFTLYSPEDLADDSVALVFPAVGVVYEGIRSVERAPRETHRVGADSELLISFVLLFRDSPTGDPGNFLNATRLLDSIRDTMKDRRSPSGHFWRFLVEAPAVLKNGNVMWIQRWTCPAILTP